MTLNTNVVNQELLEFVLKKRRIDYEIFIACKDKGFSQFPTFFCIFRYRQLGFEQGWGGGRRKVIFFIHRLQFYEHYF